MKKRILIIEDCGEISFDLKERLKAESFEVIKAYSHVSAVGMWKKYNGGFDCVVLDLNIIPDGLTSQENDKYFPLNGLAFLKEIGWDKKTSLIPHLIVYSGYTNILPEACRTHNIPYNKLTAIPKRATSVDSLIETIKKKLNA